MQKENNTTVENCQYVGPYRLEKTLGKGQTGMYSQKIYIQIYVHIYMQNLKSNLMHTLTVVFENIDLLIGLTFKG